ncbi:diacylglycerol/lipid kinase family protein [Caldimonas tepidiphila]|uniref:diacylglycerol/lipid kinase family protein n=1 Tax=Caldimonas tepidiphila TaxID=2315841 RepID=UPI000E5B165C|nr:diacylglycerol kinase family protein [Caldimonas tepidiphila]
MSSAAPLDDRSASHVEADAPLFVVLNAGSGQRRAGDVRESLMTLFAQAGRRGEVEVASRSRPLPSLIEQAVRQAQRNGGIVVAAGGDGTLNAVARAVLPTGMPMGVLPTGTFNYFGRALGIPADVDEAARLLLDAVPRPVQVGQVNGHMFLVNASLGLHPQLLEEREAFTRRFGRNRVVALCAALVTLLRRHRDMHVEIHCDGEPALLRTTSLFVGNNRIQLERIGIDEAALLSLGRLVGISLRPVGRLEMAGLLLRSVLGRLGDAAPVETFAFRELTVRPWLVKRRRRGVRVALDGETLRLEPPLRFEVVPRPLWVMAPREPLSQETS